VRMPGPDGKVAHAEVAIGDSRIMLTGEYAAMGFLSPASRGGTTVHIHLYVKDTDALTERAVKAGAKLLRKVEDQFYGDRMGTVEDPFGHVWHLATHKEDLSMAELKKRGDEAMKKASGG
jgi:PhnB protein